MVQQIHCSATSNFFPHEFAYPALNDFHIISLLTSNMRRETQLLHSKLDALTGDFNAFVNLHRKPLPQASGTLHGAVDDVCRYVVGGLGRDDIQIFTHITDVPLSATQRHRLLLIVIELVTNILRHNIQLGQSGAIWITIRTRGRMLNLEAFDSAEKGVATPMRKPSHLVTLLADSLGGDATVFEKNGFATRIAFPIDIDAGGQGARDGRAIALQSFAIDESICPNETAPLGEMTSFLRPAAVRCTSCQPAKPAATAGNL